MLPLIKVYTIYCAGRNDAARIKEMTARLFTDFSVRSG